MEAVKALERNYTKPATVPVKSGDTVRVHQRIKEGNKQRVQIFEGVVIRTRRLGEVTAAITLRRIASGVGVEKTFLLHSPNVTKVEVVRRSKVRRNFLSYLRGRRGKSARLQEVEFDRAGANAANDANAAKPETAETTDEAVDAEVTEIGEQAESVQADESLEAEVKEENKEAVIDEAAEIEQAASGDDEQATPGLEAEVAAEKPDERPAKEDIAE